MLNPQAHLPTSGATKPLSHPPFPCPGAGGLPVVAGAQLSHFSWCTELPMQLAGGLAAGRGQRGRCNRGCRGLCTPPQGPVPGTAEDTDHPPGGTAPLSGTPCPLGTGLHEKTERISARSAGKGQVMEEQWGSCPQMPGWPPAGRAGKPKEAPPTCSNIWGVTSKHSWLCLT